MGAAPCWARRRGRGRLRTRQILDGGDGNFEGADTIAVEVVYGNAEGVVAFYWNANLFAEREAIAKECVSLGKREVCDECA